MEQIYLLVENIFEWLVRFAILAIDLVGAITLCYAVVRAIVGLLKRRDHIRLHLAEGIALALQFKISGELLRTILIQDWHELLILGAVVALHVVLTVLIRWEIGLEEKKKAAREQAEEAKKAAEEIFSR